MRKITTDNGSISVELPSVDQLQKTFSELGVSDNTRVVIYETEDGGREYPAGVMEKLGWDKKQLQLRKPPEKK